MSASEVVSPTSGPWAVSSNQSYVFGRKQGPGLEPIGFVYGPACGENSTVGLRAMADCRLIAEAGTVLHETGKTPRQLADELDREKARSNKFMWQLRDTCVRAEAAENEVLVERSKRGNTEIALGEKAREAKQLADEVERLTRERDSALAFIDGVREDLHQLRCTDWFPEGSNNAALSMSENMRLIGNSCADFNPAENQP